MTKHLFLLTLQKRLSGLRKKDAEEHLNFFKEMIEDRIEEGLSEEEAVAAVGTVDEIVSQIRSESSPQLAAASSKQHKKRPNGWTILLFVLASPILVSLLISAFAVIFSLLVALWCIVISLWAAVFSLIACAFGGILAGIILILRKNMLTGIAIIGAGLFCAGLSIFLTIVCAAATKGAAHLTKNVVPCIIRCFCNKKEA